MDKNIAARILSAAVSLDKSLGEVDSVISDVADGNERQDLQRKLGDLLRFVNDNFIRPLVREYPDLDPDR